MTFRLPGFAFPVKLILALTTFVAVVVNQPLFSQNSASVNGYISDRTTGETLIAANVALLEINRGAASNTSGYYSITNLPTGSYTIAASFIGYRIYEETVELEAGETLRLDIQLIPEGVELEEIVVQSESELEEMRNIGVSQVETALIRSLPSVFEPDVFRSVQLLPGVKAASDFSSGLYIRGGSPDQTLILLDETTVYNPSHFFGFYSTFNPDAVKDVRLYKGGYPAQYGGRLGSVLTVFNKDGNRNEFSGTVSAGMLASRAMIEGPFRYGSWMIAIRRSTLEPLLAALRTQTEMVPETFYFTDVNGKLNIDASENNRFSIAFYAGKDRVKVPLNQDAEISLLYGNQTLSTTWRHIFSDRLFGSATLTGSRYFNQPEFELAQTAFRRDNDIYDWSAKSDLEFIQSERTTWSAGIWSGFLTLRFLDSFDNQESFKSRIHTRYSSAYLQNRWRPHPKWIVTAGLRGNYFSEGEYSRLEPRISLDFQPIQDIRFQAAYGRYYQFLSLITNEAFSGFDLWLTTAEGVPPSYGDQFVLGAKTVPFENYGLDIELYYRTMRDLFELNPFINNPAGLDYRELFRFGEGYAYGIELFLERRQGDLTGFLGYTFGVTRRKFPGFNQDILDEPRRGRFYPPKYDRTHDLNLVLRYRLSDRWSFTSVFNYATGQAYTEPSGRTQMDRTPWENLIRDVFIVENLNAARLPSYHRLDIGVSRAGSFFQIADGEWQFQLINAYSRQNVWFYQYDFEENPVEKNDVPLLPILPAISYTVTF